MGSDFSSGATLATTGDFHNGSSAAQAGGSERAGSVDRLVDGPSLIENNIERAEESLPGTHAADLFCMLYILLAL